MATPGQWIAGARPRTLPNAIVPVMVGTGVAIGEDGFVWWRAIVALLVALSLQIGVNYANDYSDGIRGTDDQRVGPMRLVGSRVATPPQVLAAALGCFGVAAVLGLVLVLATRAWWVLLVGAAAIAAAWFYTGGKSPYGYRALGEVAVFTFFGVVPVVGTAYVQTEQLSWAALLASIPVGLLSCSMLVVNNLRDVATDGQSGKRTLAVVLGAARTRTLYATCLIVPFVIALAMILIAPLAAAAVLAAPLAIAPVKTVLSGAVGPALIGVLQQTGKLQMAYGLLFTLGLAITL
ncbi:1,4-dihydroxy-2-naphthoate polyprenyltransferase [Nonomuraea aurantiaca]|jgi:1,4-dihydroxy-2-naphthoate octaprenyltransferase|uniref:1,4-dihydroxy-2-naphthoate polyprenyltransferase n=1 Tax=Nonomuraea aurantiaca TaxID=2878562 RepID=UPI001CD93266|nr:1,4-dihydroxy-2-naphthoate polyprenyltransferase [Nonomuraea aurantiaca]MCA2227342.1 1,4-dihydroxy-2-naphthoate polyprenyltransferase [Nonomuraea aurantiaca]